MIATDIDSLHAALDLDPADQETRCVLSDAYEEAGDMVMADGLRWMVSHDKYPASPSQLAGEGWGRYGWVRAGDEADEATCGWALSGSSARLVLAGYSHLLLATRRAVEEALCRALAGARTVPPHS